MWARLICCRELHTALLFVTSLAAFSECGNGLCEWNEATSSLRGLPCSADCHEPILATCPSRLAVHSVPESVPYSAVLASLALPPEVCSGAGVCIGATGRSGEGLEPSQCLCLPGHTGPDCGGPCARGFVRVFRGSTDSAVVFSALEAEIGMCVPLPAVAGPISIVGAGSEGTEGPYLCSKSLLSLSSRK